MSTVSNNDHPLPTLTKKSLQTILANRFANEHIHTLKQLPLPTQFKDMPKVSRRIAQAIAKQETILLVGDYDVDGVIARVIVQSFFDHIKYPLQAITPNRFRDGYGISKSLITQKLREDSTITVIITVDNGITAHEVADYCKQQAIDLIITDHHMPTTTLPNAYAIINPNQPRCPFPCKQICGAMVAWYVIAALKEALQVRFDMASLLDLLAIATIADVMPLVDVNRVIVKNGLKQLNKAVRPAIKVLKETLNKEVFIATDIAFGIAPKINAAGRLADSLLSIEFLQATNTTEAKELLIELIAINNERKALQDKAFVEVLQQVKNRQKEYPVIVVAAEDFHEGIIGIIASKVVEKLQKVVLVGSIKNDGLIKISGRSPKGIDLYSLLLPCKDLFLSFGGHKSAAGINIHQNNYLSFIEKINAIFVSSYQYTKQNDILGEIEFDHIDDELMLLIDQFEPFGEGNERPLLLIRNVYVYNMEKKGMQQNVLKLWLQKPSGDYIQAVQFGIDDDINDLAFGKHDKVNIIGYITKNIFNGITNLQILVKEIYI